MDKSTFTQSKSYLICKVQTKYHNFDYDIEKSRLPEICSYITKFKSISEWVVHLSEKNWSSRRLMLLLCDNIERICPNNEINWEETRRYIASVNYETK